MLSEIRFSLFAVICLTVVVSQTANADLIYSNGPLNGEENGLGTSKYALTGGGANLEITNSFVVNTPSHLSSVVFGIWLNPMIGLPPSVYYAMGTSPFYSDVAIDISEPANSFEFQFTNQAGFNIYKASFLLDTDVQPGTYWFSLGGLGGGYFVDTNGGPSTAFYGISSRLDDGLLPTSDNIISIRSSYFEIHGESQTAVPEPSSILLMCVGLSAIMFMKPGTKEE
jgi:PEP-CTERM motif